MFHDWDGSHSRFGTTPSSSSWSVGSDQSKSIIICYSWVLTSSGIITGLFIESMSFNQLILEPIPAWTAKILEPIEHARGIYSKRSFIF